MPVVGLQPGAIISIPVRDLKKSVAWYRKTFGFEVARTLQEPAWCELTTSTTDVRIGLAQVDGGAPGDTTPIFNVGSIEAAAAELAAVRGDLEKSELGLRGEITTLRADLMAEMHKQGRRMTTRLGAVAVAAVGIMVAFDKLL